MIDRGVGTELETHWEHPRENGSGPEAGRERDRKSPERSTGRDWTDQEFSRRDREFDSERGEPRGPQRDSRQEKAAEPKQNSSIWSLGCRNSTSLRPTPRPLPARTPWRNRTRNARNRHRTRAKGVSPPLCRCRVFRPAGSWRSAACRSYAPYSRVRWSARGRVQYRAHTWPRPGVFRAASACRNHLEKAATDRGQRTIARAARRKTAIGFYPGDWSGGVPVVRQVLGIAGRKQTGT